MCSSSAKAPSATTVANMVAPSVPPMTIRMAVGCTKALSDPPSAVKPTTRLTIAKMMPTPLTRIHLRFSLLQHPL